MAIPPADATSYQGPFSGFRMLELGSMVAGPACGQILGDLGADIIKLEPLDGDVVRGMPPIQNGCSGAFVQWNRNKRSVAVDLRSAEGRQIAQQLAHTVDVLYQNYRPGVPDEMGLAYEQLRARNPGLIYVSINGYGDSGPYADQPAYDVALQGLVGFMPTQGDGGDPQPIRSAVVDKITAYSAAMAIMAALMHRLRNGGVGQYVNVNMLDAFSAFMLREQMYNYAFPAAERPRHSVNNLYHTLRTRDGHVIGLVGRDSHFKGLLDALHRPDLANDARFADTTQRFIHAKQLMAEVAPQAAGLSTSEFMALMRKHQVPFAPVNNLEGFLADPQVAHNRSYVDVEEPGVGTIRTLGSFARFRDTPARTEGRSPDLGEHTDRILGELGYPVEVIARYREQGLIR